MLYCVLGEEKRVEECFPKYFEGLVGDNPVEVRIFSSALCVSTYTQKHE